MISVDFVAPIRLTGLASPGAGSLSPTGFKPPSPPGTGKRKAPGAGSPVVVPVEVPGGAFSEGFVTEGVGNLNPPGTGSIGFGPGPETETPAPVPGGFKPPIPELAMPGMAIPDPVLGPEAYEDADLTGVD